MSTSKEDKFPLKLNPNQKNDWLNISVFDAKNNLISKQSGSFSGELPRGMYTVVSELNGFTTEKIIKHVSPNSIELPTPTIAGFEKKIAYAEIASKQSRLTDVTFKNPSTDPVTAKTPKLFVFCHATNKAFIEEVKSFYVNLKVYDEWNNKVLQMEKDDWTINEDEGWMAYQTHLPEGMYFFNHHRNLKNNSFSISLVSGYQTQIILPFNQQPDFNAIQIGMGENSFFDEVGSDYFRSFQIAETKMLNADYNLPENVLQDLAYGKWTNPIYGVLVCYMYLLSKKRNNDELIKIVLRNLETKIFKSNENPDLMILNLLLKIHLGEKISTENMEPITRVPMFKVGVNKLIDLSYDYPALIQQSGIIDLIAGRLRHNTIWTCFKPTRMNYDFLVEEKSNKKATSRLFGNLRNTMQNAERNVENISDLLEDFLPAIIDLKRKKSQITPTELAKMIGIPYVTLKRKVNELHTLFKKHQQITDLTVNYLTKLMDQVHTKEVVTLISDLANQMNNTDDV